MTEKHYESVGGAKYESAFLYTTDSPYNAALLSDLAPRLHPGDRFMDLGGGTGNFSAALARSAGLRTRPVCVEPSEQQIALCRQRFSGFVTPIRTDAGSLVTQDRYRDLGAFDVVLCKESMHHFHPHDRRAVWVGLHRFLKGPGARIIILIRPVRVRVPLFELAERIWIADQPTVRSIFRDLRTSGYEPQIDEINRSNPMRVGDWHNAIRTKFWSTFKDMDDADIERGIEELKVRQGDDDTVFTFEDPLYVITATLRGMPLFATPPVLHDVVRKGFLHHSCYCPVDLLTKEEARGVRLASDAEGSCGDKLHLTHRWATPLAWHAIVVGAIQAALDLTDLLCRTCRLVRGAPSPFPSTLLRSRTVVVTVALTPCVWTYESAAKGCRVVLEPGQFAVLQGEGVLVEAPSENQGESECIYLELSYIPEGITHDSDVPEKVGLVCGVGRNAEKMWDVTFPPEDIIPDFHRKTNNNNNDTV